MSTQPTVTPPQQADKAKTRRLWLAIAIAVVLLIAATRASTLRDWWLNRQSLESIGSAAQANKKDLAAWSLFARRLAAADRGAEAADAYETAVAALPEGDKSRKAIDLVSDAAFTAAKFGSESQAELLLARSITIASGDVRVALAAGILAMRQKNYGKAADHFDFAAKNAPKNPEGWSRLGTARLALEQHDTAITPLTKAVELSPTYAPYHADLAECLAQMQRFPEARDRYAEAARLAPDNTDFFSQHALASASAAKEDEEFEMAATLLTTALQKTPDDAALLLTLAGLQMRFGRMDEARRSFESVVGQIPEHSDAWFNLSTVYNRLGDRISAAHARKQFQDLLNRQTSVVELTKQTLIEPRNARHFASLSQALRKAGDNPGAYRALQRASQLAPGDATLRTELESATRAMSGRAGRNSMGVN